MQYYCICRIYLLVVLLAVIVSCSDKKPTEPYIPPDVPLTYQFNHEQQGVHSASAIGIWMFKPDQISTEAIAHWETQTESQLLEPINIIWIDYSANNKEEATEHVKAFLTSEEVGFLEESYPLHTKGYYGLYADSIFLPQYPLGSSWVDNRFPAENNHGRIFPAFDAGIEQPVYYTLGAFSRESQGPLHFYISFIQAQQALIDTIPQEWKYSGELDHNWGNIISPPDHNTDDHQGVAVLVRY